MKKLELNQLELVEGGGPCETAMSAIAGFGFALLSVPVTPMNIALGAVSSVVGVGGLALC